MLDKEGVHLSRRLQFKPVSAMSRMVCLIAQIILSINNLNWAGGIPNNAKRQSVTLLMSEKKKDCTREAV